MISSLGHAMVSHSPSIRACHRPPPRAKLRAGGLDVQFLSYYERGGGRGGGQPGPALEAALRAFLTAARQPWPEPLVDEDELLRHVAERIPPVDDPVVALQGLHAADLHLACACTRGEPRALAAFETRVLPQV